MNIDRQEFWSIAKLGYVLFEQEEYEEARAVFEGLTAVAANEPYPWEALGWIAAAEGDRPRAIEFLRHALKLGAGAETAVRLGEELIFEGQYADAVTTLERPAALQNRLGSRARALMRRCR